MDNELFQTIMGLMNQAKNNLEFVYGANDWPSNMLFDFESAMRQIDLLTSRIEAMSDEQPK